MKFMVDIMFGVVIKTDEDHGVTQMKVEALENWCNRNGIKYNSTSYKIMHLKLMTRNSVINIELINWKRQLLWQLIKG